MAATRLAAAKFSGLPGCGHADALHVRLVGKQRVVGAGAGRIQGHVSVRLAEVHACTMARLPSIRDLVLDVKACRDLCSSMSPQIQQIFAQHFSQGS